MADHYADLRAVLAVRGSTAPLHRHEDTIRALLSERDLLIAQRRNAITPALETIETNEGIGVPSFTELMAGRAA